MEASAIHSLQQSDSVAKCLQTIGCILIPTRRGPMQFCQVAVHQMTYFYSPCRHWWHNTRPTSSTFARLFKLVIQLNSHLDKPITTSTTHYNYSLVTANQRLIASSEISFFASTTKPGAFPSCPDHHCSTFPSSIECSCFTETCTNPTSFGSIALLF